MATEFWIELRGAKYDANSGWHCSALTLPGAQITKIVVAGDERPMSQFTVDAAQIRFVTRPISVPDGAAKITLRKRLVPLDSAVAAALITAAGTVFGSWISWAKVESPPEQQGSSPLLAPTAALALSAPTQIASSAASIGPGATADPNITPPLPGVATSPQAARCPSPPKPDVKQAPNPYTVEVAQGVNPNVPFHEVDKAAREAADALGDQWKLYLSTSPNDQDFRAVDGIPRRVYVARWYGLSRNVAEGICCYLDGRNWTANDGSVLRHCIPSPQSRKPKSSKTESPATAPSISASGG